MKAGLICAGVLFVLLQACSDDKAIPKDVIPKQRMQNILWDLIQADKFTVLYVAKDSTKNVKSERIRLYEDVFRIHHTNKTEFEKSYQFYVSRPDISKVMFDSLAASANRKRSDVYSNPSSGPSLTPKKKIEIGKPN